MFRPVHASVACVLILVLAGCPQGKPETPPRSGDSTDAAAVPRADPDPTPTPPAEGTTAPAPDSPQAKEARAWEALQAETPWARLLPGKLKDPAARAKLEAPLNASDSAPIQRLALLVRYSPIHDGETRKVLNISVALRRMLSKSGALDPSSFPLDAPRTTALLVLPDANLMGSTRWLRTRKGDWVSVNEGVTKGTFSRDLARDLRAALQHAQAARWDQAIPLYQSVFSQLAEINSDLQGRAAQEKWKAAQAESTAGLDTYQKALDAWWRTFVPPKRG